MKRPLVTVATCVALVGSAMFAAGPASAHDRGDRPPGTPGTPVTVADGLFGPLGLEVDRGGTAYVSQNFPGILTRIDRDGTKTDLVSAPGDEIAAVSSRFNTVYYARTTQDHSSAILYSLRKGGTPVQLADLHAHEASKNPDGVNTYGFVGLPQSCLDQFPPPSAEVPPPVYTGVIDTHPYASLALGRGIYVADAGANAILRVGYNGAVSTVAVLPAQDPVPVSADVVAQFGYPACAAGVPYRFEPVPTDVELGPDGWLYVTTLPGGPEGPSLGARGSVYRVNPWNGKVVKVATGFLGATNLAVSLSSGAIFVTELFGGPTGSGQVSVLRRGASTPQLFIALSSPAAIELRRNALYVTTDAVVPGADGIPQPIGKLTRVPLTSGHGEMEDSTDDGS